LYLQFGLKATQAYISTAGILHKNQSDKCIVSRTNAKGALFSAPFALVSMKEKGFRGQRKSGIDIAERVWRGGGD